MLHSHLQSPANRQHGWWHTTRCPSHVAAVSFASKWAAWHHIPNHISHSFVWTHQTIDLLLFFALAKHDPNDTASHAFHKVFSSSGCLTVKNASFTSTHQKTVKHEAHDGVRRCWCKNLICKDWGWKLEKKGPFGLHDRFDYLKRKMEIKEDGVMVSRWCTHHWFGKTCRTGAPRHKDTMRWNDWTKFPSSVGKLRLLSVLICQYVVRGLAPFMQKPTEEVWKALRHLCSYLRDTKYDGLLLCNVKKGISALNTKGTRHENDADGHHLMEVICDADYAGNRESRKSVSPTQIYLDGNLIESYVRSQKSIALSSGESEYVCMVGGVSESLFCNTAGNFFVEMNANWSAGLTLQQHVLLPIVLASTGPVTLQPIFCGCGQKVKEKKVSITAIPTELNPADVGTKNLSKTRLIGLKYVMKMVDYVDERICENEFEESEANRRLKKEVRRQVTHAGSDAKVAMVVTLSLLGPELERENMSEMDFLFWRRPRKPTSKMLIGMWTFCSFLHAHWWYLEPWAWLCGFFQFGKKMVNRLEYMMENKNEEITESEEEQLQRELSAKENQLMRENLRLNEMIENMETNYSTFISEREGLM